MCRTLHSQARFHTTHTTHATHATYPTPERGIKGLLRVELDDAFDSHLFTATLNGRNADHLLHSGTSAGQLPDSVSLYFPPATAVNPNDAHDGPIAIFKSPLIDLTISRETEGAAHLDLGVRLAGRIPEMHGVLGQVRRHLAADGMLRRSCETLVTRRC